MRRVAGTDFRQMQAMEMIGEQGIVRRQQDQAVCLRPQCFAQRVTPFGIARAHDHQAAFGQGTGGGERIGQAVVVGH